MAFDQVTRNRLQRFVSEARALLTKEFTRQLQNDYGIDPNSGEVALLETMQPSGQRAAGDGANFAGNIGTLSR